MTESAKKKPTDFGSEFARLNSRRLQVVNEKLTNLGLSIPEEVVAKYLTEIDPEIQKWPFDNSILDFPQEEASYDWFDLLDGKDGASYKTLKKEGGNGANEIATLRSRCLLSHTVNGVPLNELLGYVQTRLTEDVIRKAGQQGLELPSAWLANTDRSKIRELLQVGQQLRTRISRSAHNPNLSGEGLRGKFMHSLSRRCEADFVAEAPIVAECLASNPDPILIASKLVNIDQLRHIAEAEAAAIKKAKITL